MNEGDIEWINNQIDNATEYAEDRLRNIDKRVAKLEDQVDRLIALVGEVVNLTAMLHERTK
jgi:hypothetical protein